MEQQLKDMMFSDRSLYFRSKVTKGYDSNKKEQLWINSRNAKLRDDSF